MIPENQTVFSMDGLIMNLSLMKMIGYGEIWMLTTLESNPFGGICISVETMVHNKMRVFFSKI